MAFEKEKRESFFFSFFFLKEEKKKMDRESAPSHFPRLGLFFSSFPLSLSRSFFLLFLAAMSSKNAGKGIVAEVRVVSLVLHSARGNEEEGTPLASQERWRTPLSVLLCC